MQVKVSSQFCLPVVISKFMLLGISVPSSSGTHCIPPSSANVYSGSAKLTLTAAHRCDKEGQKKTSMLTRLYTCVQQHPYKGTLAHMASYNKLCSIIVGNVGLLYTYTDLLQKFVYHCLCVPFTSLKTIGVYFRMAQRSKKVFCVTA